MWSRFGDGDRPWDGGDVEGRLERSTAYGYDTAGRRAWVATPDGLELLYGYDTVGRLSTITPGATLSDRFNTVAGSGADPAKWTTTTAGSGTATVGVSVLIR